MSILPPNTTRFEREIETVGGPRIDGLPAPFRTLWRSAECPAPFLPWLAWQWSVDTWDPAWPTNIKRAVIDAAPDLHRVKGTPHALSEAMTALGLQITVQEWFQYGGQPYRFRVEVDFGDALVDITQTTLNQIETAALEAKNVRSWLDELTVVTTYRDQPRAVAACYGLVELTIPFTP